MDSFKVPLRMSREGTGLTSVAESVSTDVQDDKQEQGLKILAERWGDAVLTARNKIKGRDKSYWIQIQKFPSAKALMDDLERRKSEAEKEKNSKSLFCRATTVVSPFVTTLEKTAAIFVIAVGFGSKNSPKLALIWGLAYLTITVCFWALGIDSGTFNASSVDKKSLRFKLKWDGFGKTLDELSTDLYILNLNIKSVNISETGCLEDRDAVGTAIFHVFRLLIDFWIESVRWFDSADSETMSSPELDQLFEQLRKQLLKAITTVRTLTEVNRISSSAVMQGELDRRDAMFSGKPGLTGHDHDEVTFPVTVLPRARTQAVFYGRNSTLASMDEFFAADASSTSLLSVLLQGTGGVGKTQTALHFVHERINSYDIVLWIESETPLSLTSSMTEIAKRLSFPGTESPESNLSNFHKWMNKQERQKRRCLLIYDNVETMDDNLKRYIPTTAGHMIITSRNRHAGYYGTKLIPLKPFSVEDGGCLLRQLLESPDSQLETEEDIKAATYLAHMVEGLPLGIQLIAGLINERDGESTSSFMKEYVEYPRHTMVGAPRAIGYAQDEERALDGDEHPLDRIYTMSFKSLTPPKLALMGIASFLSPDSIPRFIFGAQALKDLPDTLKHLDQVCGPAHKFIKQFNALVNVSLLERKSDQDFSIHRLIQDAFRFWCDKDQALQHFSAAVHIVHQFFPRQVNGRPMHDSWDQCRTMIQHGQILATRFHELRERFPGEIEPPPDLLELLKSCGWYLFEMADHHATIALLDTAVETVPEKARNTEVYAHLLNTIASCCFELCDLARSRRELDTALAIREAWAKKKVPGAEEELANALNNYGNLESAEGKYESALAYFNKARVIRLKLGKGVIVPLGVTHMTTGRALFLLGKHEEAIAEYKKAEKIFLDNFGPDAHFMAHLTYAYGNLELARKDMGAAKRFYTEARRILEKDTPLHLLLAACYYKIATLAEREGDRDGALELLNKGLAIAEFRGGKGDAARIMMKKASILGRGSTEEKMEAASLQIQVQEIVMEHFPNTVYVLEGNDEDEWDAWICPYWR